MAFLLPSGKPSFGVDLKGKVALVTGASSGIGFYTAKALALDGAHVIIASRNMDKTQRAAEQIQEAVAIRRGKAIVEAMHLDLGSLRAVRQFASELIKKNLPLHILVNNAGVWIPNDQPSEDGILYTVGVNHFGSTYLTELLLERIKASAPSRIVFVTSPVEAVSPQIDWANLECKGKEADFKMYALTKMENLMTVRALQFRLQGTGVEVLGAQPGIALSEIWYKADYTKITTWIQSILAHVFGQPAARGAQPIIRAAEDPSLQGKGLEYNSGSVGPWYAWSPFGMPMIGNFGNTSRRRPVNPQVYDDEACKRLYDETLRIIAQKLGH